MDAVYFYEGQHTYSPPTHAHTHARAYSVPLRYYADVVAVAGLGTYSHLFQWQQPSNHATQFTTKCSGQRQWLPAGIGCC